MFWKRFHNLDILSLCVTFKQGENRRRHSLKCGVFWILFSAFLPCLTNEESFLGQLMCHNSPQIHKILGLLWREYNWCISELNVLHPGCNTRFVLSAPTTSYMTVPLVLEKNREPHSSAQQCCAESAAFTGLCTGWLYLAIRLLAALLGCDAQSSGASWRTKGKVVQKLANGGEKEPWKPCKLSIILKGWILSSQTIYGILLP